MAFKSMILGEVAQRVRTDREEKKKSNNKLREKRMNQQRKWISNNV